VKTEPIALIVTAWLLALVLLAAGVEAAEKATYAKPKGWGELVEAARKEGAVVVYTPSQAGRQIFLGEAFGKAFPGMKVLETAGSGSVQINRILTERRANRYIPDVLIGGTGTVLLGIKPAGGVAPLKPKLILPEVLDESAWFERKLWWADSQEPYTTLMFTGYVQTLAYVNTRMVDPRQFTSYWDLLNPKWKGKIVSSDIRGGGRGGVTSRFIYKHPQLGPAYLERLFSEMDITLSADPRQMVDWLAKGRYALALFLASDDITTAQEKGLPVAHVLAEQFKEGAAIAPAGGAVSLMERAPHPNAAALFINWLLTRDGQLAWQQAVRLPSLRMDIPKTGLYSFDVPKPGAKYVNGGTEDYVRITSGAMGDLVTKALAKAGR
jgi:iron(III) transport system substrate-binding protein